MDSEAEGRARFGVICRFQTKTPNWFQRHRLELMIVTKLGLSALLSSLRSCMDSPVAGSFFGNVARYILAALPIRLIFVDRWRLCSTVWMLENPNPAKGGTPPIPLTWALCEH